MNRIIFIDVDGTLTNDKTSWQKVHHYFKRYNPNIIKYMDKHTKMWENNEIDGIEWAKKDVELWKGYPIKDLKNALLPPNLIKNAKIAITKLKENNYHVVLLSGGINILVDEVKDMVGADEAYSNIILEKDGIISGKIRLEVGNSKAEVIKQVIAKHNISQKHTSAIGDDLNDIEMFEYVNFALGINLKKEIIKEKVDKTIETDDFMDAINIILKYDLLI